mmetsp:Transcript_2761/g.17217  ORF Transcript_2761/g.17217 Transcript_2761/m.17217 type:complete len:298 (-) Transcript_2761:91-984(-)
MTAVKQQTTDGVLAEHCGQRRTCNSHAQLGHQDIVTQYIQHCTSQHNAERSQGISLRQKGGLCSHGQEHNWVGEPPHRRISRAIWQHFRYGHQFGQPYGDVEVAGGKEKHSQPNGCRHGDSQHVLDCFSSFGGCTGHHGGGPHRQEHEQYRREIDDHTTWTHCGHLRGSAESTDEGGIDHCHERIGQVDAQRRQGEFEDVCELFGTGFCFHVHFCMFLRFAFDSSVFSMRQGMRVCFSEVLRIGVCSTRLPVACSFPWFVLASFPAPIPSHWDGTSSNARLLSHRGVVAPPHVAQVW